MASRLPLSWTQLRQAASTTTTSTPTSLLLSDTTTTRLSRRPNTSVSLPTIPRRCARAGGGWSTQPKRQALHNRYNEQKGLPELKASRLAALKRKENSTPLRSGVLAIKKGMTAVFQYGNRYPCTVLQLDGCTVVANKSAEKHGYWAVQVGMGSKRPINVKAPQLGYYEAKGIRPMRHLAEFRVRNADGLLPVGSELWPDWFHKGQYVDTRSNSKGKGFAGGMKKHGFAGQEASHGNSLNHRTIGTVGPSQGGGSRVIPGKKMPGRMGGQRQTCQNLQVLGVDNYLGTVLVKGAVGGPKGGLVMIQDAIKSRPPYKKYMADMRDALDHRFPHLERHLYEARKRHLYLKSMRKRGRIMEVVEEANKMGTRLADLTKRVPLKRPAVGQAAAAV